MADRVVKSYIGLFGGFTITYFILSAIDVDFDIICNVYGKGVIIFFLIYVLFSILSFLSKERKEKRVSLKSFTNKLNMKYLSYWLVALLFIILSLVQIAFFSPYRYGDDTTYISMINDMVETKEFYTLNPDTGFIYGAAVHEKYFFSTYYQFVAMLCINTGIHPLIMCKTILGIVYILLTFMVIWIGCKTFCKDFEQSSLMFMISTVLIFFGNYSYYTLARRILIWNYNGKSVLFTIILPYLFIRVIKCFLLEEGKEKKRKRERILELFQVTFIVFVASTTTLMGVGLAAMETGLLGLSISATQKRFSPIVRSIIVCIPAILLLLAVLLRRKGGMG